MTSLHNLSTDQLRKVVTIKEKIERLEAQLAAIAGGNGAVPRKGKRRTMSAAAKERIAAAQRKRWAKVRAGKKGGVAKVKKRRKMSPAVKAKLAAIARARWAKVKASGKSTL